MIRAGRNAAQGIPPAFAQSVLMRLGDVLEAENAPRFGRLTGKPRSVARPAIAILGEESLLYG